MLVIPTSTALNYLQILLAESLTLHLYLNDRKPTAKDTASDYREPSGAGYAPIPLNQLNWEFEMEDDLPSATYPKQSWTFLGRVGKVYGYFVTRMGGSIAWIERFEDEDGKPDPVEIRNIGFELNVTPKLVFGSQR